jgi:hypothetical protein
MTIDRPDLSAGGGSAANNTPGSEFPSLIPDRPTTYSADLTTSGEAFYFKTFIIDHPARPDRHLVHATLEGPEGAVYYRGTARLDGGRAVVTLPSYFEALTLREGRTILLTNIDGFDRLAVETQGGEKVRHGRFVVVSSEATSTQAFDWEVKAARSEARLEVEPAKDDLRVERFGPYTYGIPNKPR